MAAPYEIVILLGLPLLLVSSHPLPAGDAPTSVNACSISEEDLGKLKTAISKAASSKSSNEPILSKEVLAACPILANFTEMLKTVATDMEVLKTQSVSNTEVELLRESFEEKLNELTKNKDIFERQAGQDAAKAEGEMVEKINKLQLEITKLQKEIEEETKKMYTDMAEYVFQRLKMNDTDAIKSYAEIMMRARMNDLFMKLKTDRWVLWKMINYVEKQGNKWVGTKVLNTVIDQVTKLNRRDQNQLEIGKDSLVNLLCWKFFGKTVYGTTAEDQKMFNLMKVYFPHEKNCKDCPDVKSRTLCNNNYPSVVARSFG